MEAQAGAGARPPTAQRGLEQRLRHLREPPDASPRMLDPWSNSENRVEVSSNGRRAARGAGHAPRGGFPWCPVIPWALLQHSRLLLKAQAAASLPRTPSLSCLHSEGIFNSTKLGVHRAELSPPSPPAPQDRQHLPGAGCCAKPGKAGCGLNANTLGTRRQMAPGEIR